LLTGAVRGELKQVFAFSTESEEDKSEKEDNEESKEEDSKGREETSDGESQPVRKSARKRASKKKE
jgi:minor histocompatibility antigen H13